jgi:drug/metabolite transporter (DMT)-like permease
LGLITTTAVWGLTFILVKWTIEVVDLYYFLFLRFLLASIIMLIIFARRIRKTTIADIKAGVLLGIFLVSVYIFQTVGLQYTTATNSALITGLYMVLVPIGSIIYPGKRPDAMALAGVAIATVGLILLTGYNVSGINKGDYIMFTVPALCALHIIFTGKYTQRHSAVILVVVQFIVATIVCGIASIFTFKSASMPPIGWFSLVICSIFGSCIAFLTQTAAQRMIDPTRIGIIFAMESVFGALSGWIFGGEVMTALAFVGAVLIVLGMITSEMKPISKLLFDKLTT